MPFRFVHTADLHLDSPLATLALRDGRLAALVAEATRTALTRIVDLCLDEKVDALIIAGDLYDGGQASMKTALFMARELGRLDAQGIPTFVVRGNHDAASRLTRELALPDSVIVFGTKPGIHVLECGALSVALHGVSFPRQHVTENLFERFQAPVRDAVNIGILHTSLDGAPGHDDYAPVALTSLRASGFDYWALGHIHQPASYLDGATKVVMAGIPQARDIGEAGEKSVALVTIADDRTITLERREVASVRFERVRVSCDGLADEDALLAATETELRKARSAATTQELVVRIMLVGGSSFAWRLRRDRDIIEARIRDVADSIGGTWVELVDNAVAEPTGERAGAVGELGRIISAQSLSDPGLRGEASRILGEVVHALPPEIRDAFGADEAQSQAILQSLLEEGAREALASLHDAPMQNAEE